MTIETIMKTDIVTLLLSDTFGKALRIMTERRIRSLPVVNSQGIYQGMVDFYDVWEVLLPKAATINSTFLRDLSFISGSKEKLQEMIAQAADRPVSEFVNHKDVPAIDRQTPVQEAIRLLYHHGGNIPVIDKQTRKLVGIVAPWEIIDAVAPWTAEQSTANVVPIREFRDEPRLRA